MDVLESQMTILWWTVSKDSIVLCCRGVVGDERGNRSLNDDMN